VVIVGPVRIARRGVVVLATVTASSGVPPATAADESAVDVGIVPLVDISRPTPPIGDHPGAPVRDLQTVVWLPETHAPSPLIVLAHGYNGHPRKFSELAEHWAEAGYVVAVPRFPVTNDDFPERDAAFDSARIGDLAAQADDVVFVIDALRAASADSTSAVAGRIDPDRLGLYGMSIGALTVWAASARDALAGEVDALVQSDGAHPGDAASLADAGFPVLIAHSDSDPIFPAEARLREFGELPTPKFLLVLHGAVHAAVAENTPTAADEPYRIATTVFWDRYVAGRTDEEFPPSIVIDGVTSFVDGSSRPAPAARL
jgi:predicted dienelactone hydrolase